MHQPVLARAGPIAPGAVVLIAGAIQFTSLKAHHLGCCRDAPGCSRALPADTGTALRFGLGLGLHCCYCCASFTAVLLAIGVMDLRAMALVTAGITAERVAPTGERLAHAIGFFVIAAGFFLIARAAGIG
jgi:predicted metal-binding membrane protein